MSSLCEDKWYKVKKDRETGEKKDIIKNMLLGKIPRTSKGEKT